MEFDIEIIISTVIWSIVVLSYYMFDKQILYPFTKLIRIIKEILKQKFPNSSNRDKDQK